MQIAQGINLNGESKNVRKLLCFPISGDVKETNDNFKALEIERRLKEVVGKRGVT